MSLTVFGRWTTPSAKASLNSEFWVHLEYIFKHLGVENDFFWFKIKVFEQLEVLYTSNICMVLDSKRAAGVREGPILCVSAEGLVQEGEGLTSDKRRGQSEIFLFCAWSQLFFFFLTFCHFYLGKRPFMLIFVSQIKIIKNETLGRD